MRNKLVYDLPTRLFHWMFATCFVATYAIASTAEHSPLFSWHMMAGAMIVLMVVLRLIWGALGTRHARFEDLQLHPRSLLVYIQGVFSGKHQHWPGHNPASSWAAVIMVLLAAGLGVTGFLMTRGGDAEAYEDVHELLANAFLIVALLHIAGVIFHAVRHRDGLPLSMVDGKKQQIPDEEAILRTRPLVALLFILIVAGSATALARNYDAATQQLDLFGTTLQLGETEDEGHDDD